MNREEIKKQWPILDHFTTLKRASFDKTNKQYMTESTIEVIDFDKIPNEYARGKHWPGVPKSNDALFIDHATWTFIEFKNGKVEKDDIYRKIYDSIIMMLELNIIPSIDFVRNSVNYILVCNNTRPAPSYESEHRKMIHSHTKKLAKSEIVRFELDKLLGYLLAEVHTYSPEEFEVKFVNKHALLGVVEQTVQIP